MRAHQAEAILLSVSDLQEADRVVEFLTREEGKRRGAARGAKRRFSRFAGELQPLAKVRVGWFEKEGRELVRIASVELLRAPKRLQADLEGLLIGAYLGESVATFAQIDEPAERLFRLLDATVEALEEGGDRRTLLRYFDAWLLRLAGVFPPPLECPLCGASLESGAALTGSGESLVCRRCAAADPGAIPVSSAAVGFWLRIGGESPARVAARALSEPLLAETGDVVRRVRRHFLGHELRSHDVMRRTLGDASPA